MRISHEIVAFFRVVAYELVRGCGEEGVVQLSHRREVVRLSFTSILSQFTRCRSRQEHLQFVRSSLAGEMPPNADSVILGFHLM
jgi:hypothetical protein